MRSERSLIQTIGRAARNSEGKVILYADTMTESMRKAIEETNRRRQIQDQYNKDNGITPKTIKKEIREAIHSKETHEMAMKYMSKKMKNSTGQQAELLARLDKEMREAARILDFERAAQLRDMILEIKSGEDKG